MKFRCACLILMTLLLCGGAGTAWGEESPPAYEYAQVYRRISEPCGSSYILSGNIPQAVMGERTYEFHPKTSLEQRAAFLSAQEQLCAYLEAQGVSTAGLTFRALPNYVNWTDSANQNAYFDLDSIRCWQQVLTTVQAVYGDYTNYGYLYALADQIAGELGWAQEEPASIETLVSAKNAQKLADLFWAALGKKTEAADPMEMDGALLNLVYPCFDQAYNRPGSIAACKKLAKELLAGIENIWSEEAFLLAREAYAREKGMDFQPTYLTFAYNSPSCPLKFRTRYLDVCKDSTYKQDYYRTTGYLQEDYFSNVPRILSVFHDLDQRLSELQKNFAVEDPGRLSVQLRGGEPAQWATLSIAGVFEYRGKSARVESITVHVLPHEFAHYLFWLRGGTEDPAHESWLNEVAAEYFTQAELFHIYHLIGTYENPAHLRRIEKLIGEAFDEPADYIPFSRKSAREWGDQPYQYYLKTEYLLRAAFGEYVVRTYGEGAFLNSVLFPSRAKEWTGKTIQEIVDDWCVDMDQPEHDKMTP